MKKSERWTNKWSKVKTLLKTNQGVVGRFFTNCVRSVSCKKYMGNNSTKQKGRKISTSHYQSKFRAQWYGLSYQKMLESLEEKKAGHTSCKHGVRRIFQLYTKLKWCEPARDHLNYRKRDNIQRSSPQNTGRAKTVTTLCLEECDFGRALGARTFYISPLRKCQKTYRKTVWLLIF